jgi:opacity protein-like surface antigen
MTARNTITIGLAAALLVLLTLPVSAQSQGDHGYVIGLGGLNSTEVKNAPFFAGAGGFNLTNDLQITGEVGRIQDVLANFTHEDLTLLDQGLLTELGLPSTTTVKVPTNYVMGGVRYLLPVGNGVRPYVAGGAGIAHMSPKTTFLVGGVDLTKEVMGDELIKKTFREETRPMVSVGGGVAVKVARYLTLDGGYRYSGVFIKTDYLQDYEVSPHKHDRINTHRFYAGAGFIF